MKTPIEQYISKYGDDIQYILNKIREIVKKNSPEAEEVISYNIPTFKLNGNLIHFAVFKNHIGFYPTPSGIENFKDELIGYKTSKGAIQFPLNKEIPYELIEKIVKFRINENTL